MTPLERKFRGGGEVYTKEPSVGGGGWIFSGITQSQEGNEKRKQ